MTQEKFIYDSETVLKFVQFFCDNKHQDEEKIPSSIKLNYKSKDLNRELHYTLCIECQKSVLYSYTKLQTCPKDIKPSCRKCDAPCYGKQEWKTSAKIMKYSGMKFGFTKIKKLFKRGA